MQTDSDQVYFRASVPSPGYPALFPGFGVIYSREPENDPAVTGGFGLVQYYGTPCLWLQLPKVARQKF